MSNTRGGRKRGKKGEERRQEGRQGGEGRKEGRRKEGKMFWTVADVKDTHCQNK